MVGMIKYLLCKSADLSSIPSCGSVLVNTPCNSRAREMALRRSLGLAGQPD